MDSQQAFRKMLLRIADRPAKSLTSRQATWAFRKALLNFGSKTPDNLSCAAEIRVAICKDKDRRCNVTGLALGRQRRLVSDILNDAEGIPIPSAVRKRHSSLTQREWNALLRLATLIFISLERNR